ncbi:hypothetical protein CL638_01640 [bacterium]|nr:hypothetical protein [bacterium]
MWDFFIRNNQFAYLFLLALLVLGAFSVAAIPKESSPEVVVPIGIVTTVLPGAPALDIETLITNEIESGLSNLENVSSITSTSREGVSSVVVEFDASADIDTSIQELKDEVDKIIPELPTDAEDPTVSEVDFVDQPILTLAISGDVSDEEFTSLSNTLEKQLESVAGVSRVEITGVRNREVSVIVDQAALARFELSITDITNALQAANRTFPIGQITTDDISYNIAFEGDIENTTDIANVAITTRGGQPVYVKDVAVIEDGLSPANSLSRLSIAGEPSNNAINVAVYKRSGGDITTIAAAVNERVTELQSPGELLENYETSVVLDSGQLIRDDLIRLSSSGLQTVVLVVLLIVAAIGWREGLLAGLAIPLSFLIGFIGLYFSGNTINFLSLFSLILGIGILVDSAIVMVEGINRRMKDNPEIDKKEAAIGTIHDFSAPLISGTLTTVSMFVGLFIVSGVIGQFISSIPFTLIFLLFASLFVSLGIIPLFAASFLKRRNATPFEQKQLAYAQKLEIWYKDKLRAYLESPLKQHQYMTLLAVALVSAVLLAVNIFAAALAGALTFLFANWLQKLKQRKNWSDTKRKVFWYPGAIAIIVGSVLVANTLLPIWPLVKVVFFEQSDTDYVIVEVELPEGTVKEVTDIETRRVEEVLYDEEDITSFLTTVGSGSQFGSGGSGEKFANIFVNLDTDRSLTSTEIVEDLREQMAIFNDFTVTVDQPSDGPPTGAAIVVKFLGDDLNALTDITNQSALIAQNVPGTANIEKSTNSNSTEYVIDLDREKAAAFGLNPLTVSQTLRTAVFGTEATSLTTTDSDIDVVVKLNTNPGQNITAQQSNVTTINEIAALTIDGPTGPVTLENIATISLRESSSVISHEDKERVVSVTADVREGANARDVQAAVLEAIQTNIDIPEDITISTGGGETEESNQAFMEMFAALIVGVLLMVGVLVLQFNSYLHTRYVLSILPYSLIGIMVGLAITRSPLSFPSIMGFIALSGIVVNNSILLIDMMNQMRKRQPDLPTIEVVLESASSRLRPILLTSTTTVIGMVPLIFAGDLWAPLAYAVMFGLIFSVLITLVLIPIIYYRKPGMLN